MPDGVLLDTSFLISFADPGRKNHEVAYRYFRYFSEAGVPMFVSTIVASEFHLKQSIFDLPLDALVTLPFNIEDAVRAARLDFTKHKGTPGVARDSLKDDFKLLGQAQANDIAYIITDDARSLFRFCEQLRASGDILTRAIKLEDGFDKSHFEPGGQLSLEGRLYPDEVSEAVPAGELLEPLSDSPTPSLRAETDNPFRLPSGLGLPAPANPAAERPPK